MARLSLVLFPLTVAMAFASPAPAQRSPVLDSSISVASKPDARHVGVEVQFPNFASSRTGTMEDRLIVAPMAEFPKLEVRRVSTGTNMAIGAAAGVALGVVLTFAQPGCSVNGGREWADNMCGVALIGFALNGAWLGAGVGYLVGRNR